MVKTNAAEKTCWDLFIIILAVYNCFQIPFQIAFEPPFLEFSAFTTLNSIIDVMFLLDILIAFRTTYFDMHSGEEVFSGKKTSISYLKSRFFIDFVSTVPVDTISEQIFKVKNKNLTLFSTLKLVRVTRISRMIARLNVARETKHVMKLMQLIFFLVMYLHVLGCIWFWVVQVDEFWRPPLDQLNEGSNFYTSNLLY